MTVADQLKIIDNKIKVNQAQYDLDRLTAEISPYTSGDLKKYEYLTGQDLGYNRSVVEQDKFDYSPLGKVFKKGLTEEDKKEGLSKRVKNIEHKNKELLKAIKYQRIKQPESKKTETKNDLIYDPNHIFYKYRLSKFSQISSIEFKFDTLEMFTRDFTSLNSLKLKKKGLIIRRLC